MVKKEESQKELDEDELYEEDLEKDMEELDDNLNYDEIYADDEEDLEEVEEEDNYELEDILAEEKLKSNSNRLHQFLMAQNNKTSLTQKEITPILNLEEDLPEPPKNQSNQIEEDTSIDYLTSPEENNQIYKPSRTSAPTSYIPSKDFNRAYTPEDQFEQNQKQLYSSIQNISSEMAFVQKQMKPNYSRPDKIKEDEFLKEHKKTVENAVDKMRENYK